MIHVLLQFECCPKLFWDKYNSLYRQTFLRVYYILLINFLSGTIKINILLTKIWHVSLSLRWLSTPLSLNQYLYNIKPVDNHPSPFLTSIIFNKLSPSITNSQRKFYRYCYKRYWAVISFWIPDKRVVNFVSSISVKVIHRHLCFPIIQKNGLVRPFITSLHGNRKGWSNHTYLIHFEIGV